MTSDDDERATGETQAEETEPPGDERSREEPAGRDAEAPRGAFGSGIAPELASGASADPSPADESERSREEPAGRDAEAPRGAFGSGIAPELASGASADPSPADKSDPTPANRSVRAWSRLRRDKKSAGILIGVLTAILGFAIAVQVRSNSSSDSLSNAREDDLIRILDDQNARAERLNQQIADLQATLDEVQRSGNSDAVAQQQAERELQSLE